MNRTNAEMFDSLLDGVAPEDIPNITFGLNAALSNALAGVLTGMMTLEESFLLFERAAGRPAAALSHFVRGHPAAAQQN